MPCFSAAYAIGSAADRLFVTRTGGVGSIGVIALHVDQSVADAQDGLCYSAICAGTHKNDLSPHAPLADGAKAALQAEVNRIYALFTQTVARNRQCSVDFICRTDAALFFGPDAVTAGLADGVASLGDVVQQLHSQISQPSAAKPALTVSLQEVPMQETETLAAIVAEAQPAPPSMPQVAAVTQAAAPGPHYEHAVEIAQLCQLAGMADRTAEFLASGHSVAQVRQTLLAARAVVPAISSHSDPLHNPQRADLLMKVMKQRVGKEN